MEGQARPNRVSTERSGDAQEERRPAQPERSGALREAARRGQLKGEGRPHLERRGQEGRGAVGKKGGEAGSYDDWTVAELKKRAKQLDLTGYSGKRKSELIEMLREH